MDDHDIIGKIDSLVDEEHRLHERSREGSPLTADDHARLEHLEVQLDQCWDLLRQRRALRDSGADPGAAQVRDESTVEHYQQ
jgi:hypothetical protein